MVKIFKFPPRICNELMANCEKNRINHILVNICMIKEDFENGFNWPEIHQVYPMTLIELKRLPQQAVFGKSLIEIGRKIESFEIDFCPDKNTLKKIKGMCVYFRAKFRII